MAPIVTLRVTGQRAKPGLVIEVDHNAPRSYDDWRRASGDEVAIIAMTT